MSQTFTASAPLTAQYFLSSLGVDTHIPYTDGGYVNIQNDIADLKYLGITQVRDGITNGENGSAPLSSYITLAQAGIRFVFVMEASSTAGLNSTLGLINQLATAVPGSVLALEGSNEINNQPITYNGVSGLQGALNEQAALYSAVHSDPSLPGVPVYYFTGYDAGGIALGPDPSTTPGLADYDNQHPYPNYGQAPAPYVARSATLVNETSSTAPAVYTETGYSSLQENADVQAKYELDLLMDAASQGISKTFLYELMDAYAPGSPQGDGGWGFFDYTKAPKEAASALHNLTALFQDSGANASSFTPAAFTYSLTGLPSTGNSLAMEKSDGTKIISVWNEPQIWNSGAGTEITAATTNVTVALGATYGVVNVFDPLVGASPIASYANVNSVTIGVTDHPLLVEFGSVVTTPTLSVAITTPSETLTASGSTAALTVTGTVSGASGTTVQVFDGATALGAATVSGGTWSFAASLAVGAHSLTAVATDPTGAKLNSASDAITVASAPTPLSVAITTPSETLTASGSTAALTVTGTVSGASGTTVQVFDGATALGAATVSGGTWSFAASLALGGHSLTAVATDPTGAKLTSASDAITVASAPTPLSVAITTPSETLTASGATAALTVTGTVGGASGTTVQVFDGATALGAATVSGGTWSFATSLAVGGHSLTAVATDPTGAKLTSASDAITVASAPTGGTDTLTLNVSEIPKSGQNAAFTVSVDGNQIGGTQTVTALQASGASQNITLTGNFGAGSHNVAISYLTGFTGNPVDAGRTLYLNAITFDNATQFPSGQFAYNGTTHYTVQTPATPIASNAGSADTLTLNLSETAASGQNAEFEVSVDGQIVGGMQTVTASHAAGASQNVTLTGNFGAGAHTVTLDFVNGFAGASADLGRTLYVNAITLDGATTTENSAQLYVGAESYKVAAGSFTPALSVAITTPSETLTASGSTAALTVTGTVSGASGTTVQVFDGATALGAATVSGGTWSFATSLAVGGHSLTAVATDPTGAKLTSASDAITVASAPTPLSVAITTPSETLTASGSTAALMVTGTVSGASGTTVQVFDGATALGAATVSGGTWSFAASLAVGGHSLTAVATDPTGAKLTSASDAITVASAPTGGADTLTLNVSEIPKSGQNAAFTVSVDGIQIGGTQTVTALQASGASQNITLTGNFGAGSHNVAISYLTGFTGNPVDAGRTLYLNAITFDNATQFPSGQFAYNGTTHYTVQTPATPIASNAGSADTLTLNLSETAASGQNAEFEVSVDGQIVGGMQTVTASHAAGASQNVTLTGNFGAGAHTVTLDFVNGFAGASADLGRTLYVNAITLDGATTTENSPLMFVGPQSYKVASGSQASPAVLKSASLPATTAVAPKTYAFSAGQGALEIKQSTASTQVDFGAGLTEHDLWFQESGHDLVVTALHSHDHVRIDGLFGTNPLAEVPEFVGGDGLKLTDGFRQLLSAMASYETSHPRFDPATATAMPNNAALLSAIAASWDA